MSDSSLAFTQSILDAENLLKHFNKLNVKPPPPEIEVLKRAGLVMALTAWETFVEDRLIEASIIRLKGLADSNIANFIQSKLEEEIKRLHNPHYDKTMQLFKDFVGIDLTEKLAWNNFDSKSVKLKLNQYIKLRGDVVHRSKPILPNNPNSHAVTKDELEKVIRFLKCLVESVDKALAQN